MQNIRNWSQKGLAIALATAIALMGILFFAFSVNAHTDPGGCFSNGVGLSVTVYRANGTTPVATSGGTVQSGETIQYGAVLNHLGGSNCNFEGGTLTITTPDGVAHIVASPAIPVVPLVTSGSPFIAPQQSYIVSETNVGVDNDLDAVANYSGGVSHTGTGHDTAAANVDINTPFQDIALEVTKTATPASQTTY